MSGHLEICVDSLAGARAALAGGADALELCSVLAVGGLTPSRGLTDAVLALPRREGVTIRAMVRPRPGGFEYDGDDMATAIADARALLGAGIDGLVFGATRGDGLDREAIQTWRDAIGTPPHLTLHRAIDLVDDAEAAVEIAIALGFDQILSSGGAPTAWEGCATLARMTAAARGECLVIAGSGIAPDIVVPLVAATGITAIHASARLPSTAAGIDAFGFGRASPPAAATVVAALRRALDGAAG